MLYVTTRDKRDAFTAHRAIFEEYGPDGGRYIPFSLPEFSGEEIAAFIILKKGEKMTVCDVKDYVRTNMARHKVPSYVQFVESFPMTGSGKIQKFKLRQIAADIVAHTERKC